MKVKANGIEVHYDEAGGGPAVALIHGLGADLTMWDAQVPALSRRFRVVRYDVRGQGKSEAPPGPYTMELLAQDLRGLVDALHIERSAVIGLSMGGMIAQRFALEHPDRVWALVLADTRAETDEETKQIQLGRAQKAVQEGMEGLISGAIQRWFVPETIENRPELIERFREILRRNSPAGYAACVSALGDHNALHELSRISCPTLIVVGEEDVYATPVQYSENMYERIRGSRLVTIPHASHMSAVEQPNLFNTAVVEFLSEVVETVQAKPRE